MARGGLNILTTVAYEHDRIVRLCPASIHCREAGYSTPLPGSTCSVGFGQIREAIQPIRVQPARRLNMKMNQKSGRRLIPATIVGTK